MIDGLTAPEESDNPETGITAIIPVWRDVTKGARQWLRPLEES